MTLRELASERWNPALSVWGGFTTQFRVVGALVMREIYTRYGRENIGFLWVFGEPILFITGVLALRGLLFEGRQHGIPLIIVIATGYPALVVWRDNVNRSVSALRSNYSLLFHRQVLPLDIFLSRFLVEIAGVTIATFICYSVLVLLGIVDFPKDWTFFIIGWLFHMWYAAACGLLVGAMSEIYTLMEKVVHIFTYLSLPICGAFYLVFWLPYPVRRYAELLPSVNAYEIMRYGYFGSGYHFYYDIPYLISVLTIITVVALLMLKLAQRRLIIQ